MSPQPSEKPPIALLAGEGDMPLRIAENIRASGRRLFLIAFRGITTPSLVSLADDVVYLQVSQLGKAIRECHKRKITEATMAGRIPHQNIFRFSSMKFDWTAVKLLWQLKDKRANGLVRGVIDAFWQKGITFLHSTEYLREYLAKEGVLTKKAPSSSILADMEFGKKLAKELGRLDIGQTVVVKDKTVVAVEAMEGTDQCLERAGQIAGKGVVVVKMAKPNQDMRFDVPVIGINTLHKLSKIGAAGLAIEAGYTLLLDPHLLQVADDLGLTIVSFTFGIHANNIL